MEKVFKISGHSFEDHDSIWAEFGTDNHPYICMKTCDLKNPDSVNAAIVDLKKSITKFVNDMLEYECNKFCKNLYKKID